MKPVYPPGTGAHLPRRDVGPVDARDHLCRNGHATSATSCTTRSWRLSVFAGPIMALRQKMFRWSRRVTSPASRCPRRSPKAFKTAVGGTMTQIIPFSNTPQFLTGVIPSSNTVSNANELSRFAEMLCRGGELDGVRVMSAETCAPRRPSARRLRPDIATGLMPMRWGTGYMLGSKRFGPFGRDAAAAFGHTGLTDIAVWADPDAGAVGRRWSAAASPAAPRGEALPRAAGPDQRRDAPADPTRSFAPVDELDRQTPSAPGCRRPVTDRYSSRPGDSPAAMAVVVDQRLDLDGLCGSAPGPVSVTGANGSAQPRPPSDAGDLERRPRIAPQVSRLGPALGTSKRRARRRRGRRTGSQAKLRQAVGLDRSRGRPRRRMRSMAACERSIKKFGELYPAAQPR